MATATIPPNLPDSCGPLPGDGPRRPSQTRSDRSRYIHPKLMLTELAKASGRKISVMSRKLPRDLAGRFAGVPVWSRCEWTRDDQGHYIDPIPPGEPPWAWLTIVVKAGQPVGARRSSRHRTYVECSCNRLVPTGRYHQHAPYCPVRTEPTTERSES